MYECQRCGNTKYFIEYNCVKTEITIDEETSKVTENQATFVARTDVECGFCRALMSKSEITEVR